MKFSERIGATPVKNALQIGVMDQPLRNGLWNAVSIHFLRPVSPFSTSKRAGKWRGVFLPLWSEFFKQMIDSMPDNYSSALEQIRNWYQNKAGWNEVYDFVEFFARPQPHFNISSFITKCNRVMEREMSGYRFVGNEIALITSETEIKAIEEAVAVAAMTGLRGVETHLKTALHHFADRSTPDYRNSIKESISAVEAVARAITGNKKATLGEALKRIDNEIALHESLKKGFSSIYGYTSDDDGIRHGLTDEPNVGSDDARFMLVSCSAFVHYLIEKAEKAGMLGSKL